MSWSAAQYTKFEDERTRPVRDLLAQVPNERVDRAVDIGCGPGNSTELLAKRYPQASMLGIDSSANMIEAARKRLPHINFEVADIATWRPLAQFDVVLGNAVLQWVPDHAAILPALLDRLAPGGTLAIQIPDNLDEPAHRLMRETAAAGPWADRLQGTGRAMDRRRSAEWYFRTLRELGAKVDVWRTIYQHPLSGGASAIVEWFKGTALKPFLDPLDERERLISLHGTKHRSQTPIRSCLTEPCCCRLQGCFLSRRDEVAGDAKDSVHTHTGC
jgi:trans-aconitate 2-methyltransferase